MFKNKKSYRFISIVLFVYSLILSSCVSEDRQADFELQFPIIKQLPTILEHEVGIPASAERFKDPRPNIIIIMTDDQPYHTVNYMPTVKGELMAEGIVFENGFATTPLCCPSRSSILTGEYAHNHEVYTNRLPLGGASKFNDTSTLAVWLKSVGYKTAYYGKYLNEYESLDTNGYIPPGWDYWNAFLGKNVGNEDSGSLQFYFNFSMVENGFIIEYPRSKYNFSADVVTQKAINFINQSQETPFLMFVSYYNPHSPYISAPRHKETFRANSGWDWIQYRPPNFNEQNIKDKPAYIEQLSPLSPNEIDTAHKQILRSLLSVDDGVATILNMLEQTHLNENTIIFFISDNGLTLGDHRFGVTKNCPYEACILIPFIVYSPYMYEARTDKHLVANIDLAPTIAELAGVTIPNTVNGVSMVSLLENPEVEWRNEILIEHWPTEEGIGSIIPEFYSIRTAEWKYTEYSTGEVELYDLINDPYELVNIAEDQKYKEIQSELRVKLEKLKQE